MDHTTARPVEYEDASPEVREVYDDIMASRGIDFIPNAWKVFASHPPTLKRTWNEIKEVMIDGSLSALQKEMIAVAVSATNGCEYCVQSHAASARKLGMTPEMFGELVEVVALFNKTNKLAEAYQIPVDEIYYRKD